MGGVFHAFQAGVCWILSLPPQAYEQVANFLKTIICGGSAPSTP